MNAFLSEIRDAAESIADPVDFDATYLLLHLMFQVRP